MADANLLLDISHLWEDAVFRVLDRYPGPIVATHANPRFFVDSPRQISDDMIRGLTDRDGVVGVVAYNRMLDPDWRPDSPRLPLRRLVQAIDHVCQIAGDAAHVGLGTDLDGGFGQASVPAELASVADLHKVVAGLKDLGYAESDIKAVMGGNWLRVMRVALEAF
jgi:membrane dipeptidase